jgi:hypothetical protein
MTLASRQESQVAAARPVGPPTLVTSTVLPSSVGFLAILI